MAKRRFIRFVAVVLAAALLVLPDGSISRAAVEALPGRLTDQEFWRLASEFSEPDGTFHSENLVSNEARYQTVIPPLLQKGATGGAYIGVGSEQNFTYIAALRPSIAFIVDIRRGNLDLHLIYKALFELSANRAEFVSRLFSRRQPGGLSTASTAAEIFSAYANTVANQALYDQNLKDIKGHLATKHGFKLTAGDMDRIDFVYNAWFRNGPRIQYELSGGGTDAALIGGIPTYADLMTATDGEGKTRSYLASEDAFRFLKDLQTRNMIVPVVGNFAGPKALRSVAAYLKQNETTVSVFYVSNVEQYLHQDGIWGRFCASVATFPLDARSTFVRSARPGFAAQPNAPPIGTAFTAVLGPIRSEVANCPR